MAEARAKNIQRAAKTSPKPRSAAISNNGIYTGEDFARLMSALMSDTIEGRIAPGIANAVCNAGGKLLKIVEMQYRYGSSEAKARQKPNLMLTGKENVRRTSPELVQ